MGATIAILSYFTPPMGTVPSHRVLRLSRVLLAEGHEVHWITLDRAKLDKVDATLEPHIPKEIVRHGLGGPSLVTKPQADGFIEKVLRTLVFKLPRWFALADGHLGWTHRLKRRLAGLLKENEIDTLFVTCGPHGQIMVLPRIRKAMPELRILVDYRDLLTGNLWQAQNARRRERLLKKEQRALQAADAMFLNTEEARHVFVEVVRPNAGMSVQVMRNAADYEFGNTIAPVANATLGEGVHIGYFGTIFQRRRLRPILEAVTRLPGEVAGKIRMHVYTDDWSMRFMNEDIEAVGGIARKCVVRHEPCDYGQALAAMRAMDALLLINGPTHEDRIYVPGKLYDYLMAQRPTLFVGQEGDAWRIVVDTSGEGWCARHDQPELIDAALLRLGNGRPHDTAVHAKYGPGTTFEPLLAMLRQPSVPVDRQ